MPKHFDHVTVAATKVAAAGVRRRNQPMPLHDRELVFLEGPEGIIVEPAEWK